MKIMAKPNLLIAGLFQKMRSKINFLSGMIGLATVGIIVITLLFTYSCLRWTGIMYNVKVLPDYLELTEASSEASRLFSDLAPGDRIIALDGIKIAQILQDETLSQNSLLFYPAQKGQHELTLVGSRISAKAALTKQEVLLWSLSTKNLTLEVAPRKDSPPATSTNAPQTAHSQPLEPVALTKINLNTLKFNSEKDALILILAISGIFFSAVGLFFFIIKKSQLTLIYWLNNQLVCLELVISSMSQSYIGSLEKTFLVGAGSLLGPVFLHLMILFPDKVTLSRRAKLGVSICYGLMVGLILIRLYLILLAPLTEIVLAVEGVIARLSRLGLFITCCLGLSVLLVRYFRSEGQRRLRIRLAVFAFAFGMLVPMLAVAYYLIASLWQPVIYDRFGLFLLPCVVLPPLIGYAVVKNQLFGLTTVVRYFTTYLFLTLLVITSYFVITIGLVALIPIWDEFSHDPIIITLVLSLLCVLLYQLRTKLQRLIDQIFRFDPYDYSRLVQSWQYRLLKATDLKTILEEVIFNFPIEFYYAKASLIIWQPSIKELLNSHSAVHQGQVVDQLVRGIVISSSSSGTGYDQLSYEIVWLQPDNLKLLEKEKDFLSLELFTKVCHQEGEAGKVKFTAVQSVFLLRLETEIYGMLLLDEKVSTYLPTDEERTHLVTLAHQLTIALHNVARLVEEKQLKEMYKDILNHEERAREQERLNFSGLIHDDLLQRLAATKVSLAQMRREASSKSAEPFLNDIYEDIETVILSLRNINSALMPVHLQGNFLSALKEFLYQKQLQFPQIQFEFVQSEGEWSVLEQTLDIEFKVNLYRFFEEATNNAIKHSQATKIAAVVTLCPIEATRIEAKSYQLNLEIKDDGCGVDLQRLQDQTRLIQDNHFGIHTMKRRIELIGGSVSFESSPDKGMSAKAVLPISLSTATESVTGLNQILFLVNEAGYLENKVR